MPIEPPQSQSREVSLLRPGRPEFRAGRGQHQNRKTRGALDHERQQFERARVDPVHILEKDEHGLARGKVVNKREQRRQRPVLALLRR